MAILNHVQPPSLGAACESFIVRYMHHVVWRQLDPPPGNCHSCFKPSELPMVTALPERRGPVKDPVEFRKRMTSIRSYLSECLVRPVHDNLVRTCQKFVSENRLKYGDVLLYLIFQDQHSSSLSLTAKQVVFKRWKVREKMCLIRTLRQSHKLTKLEVPGIVNDSLLFVIAENCRLLEELDVSTSYITDKGILALAGVIIKDAPEHEGESLDMEVDLEEEAPSGKRRKAATAAISRLEVIKNDKSFLRKLAYGRSVSKELEENFSLLASKMKPYFSKRTDCPGAEDMTWSPSRGCLYRFNSDRYGCPRLRRIDLTRTSYPKRTMDNKGNKVVTLGVTRDSVLALLILMEQLIELRWQELGDILQLYEMLTLELLTAEERMGTGELRLVSFMDISTNVEKIKTAAKLCPDIVKLDLSMFNFSSYYENITQDNSLLGYGIEASSSAEGETEHSWVDQLFSFKHLKDLEAVFLDDSPAFLNNIRLHGPNLTRLCLNKMISISVSTLASIKAHCTSLAVLELHVDKITSETENLGQALEAAEITPMPSLKSLKVGGSVNSGDVLSFLVSGCPNLQILCFTPFTYQGDINDDFIVNLFRKYPCPELEVFCFEKCILSEQTFFHLLEKMSKIRFIGNMGEWTMDRRARLAIRAFIKGNNINIDIESLFCNYDFDVYF